MKECPICTEWRYISLVKTCPICGSPGKLGEIQDAAEEFFQQYWIAESDPFYLGE